MIQPVTDPDGYLRKVKRDGTLLGALAVVAVAGLVGATEWLLYGVQAANFGLEPILQVVVGPLALATLWVALTATFYLASFPFSGRGGFLRTLKLVGWGFVPSIVSNLVTVTVVAGILFTTGVSGGTASVVREKVAATSFHQVVSPTAFGLVFVLWNAMFWTFAVKHGRETTLREAALVVCLPMGLVLAGLLLL